MTSAQAHVARLRDEMEVLHGTVTARIATYRGSNDVPFNSYKEIT
jgi:hypothetical protein